MPIYMRIEGYPGDSDTAGYEGWIEVSSFSWGVSQTGLSKPNFDSLHFTCNNSSSMTRLMLACATGKHLNSAVLSLTRSGTGGKPQEYMRITMTDILVSSFQQGGNDGEIGYPMTSMSLNFSKITYRTYIFKPDGSSTSQQNFYDLAKGVGG